MGIPTLSWAALLERAVNEPEVISEAYSQFHNFNIGNTIPEKSAQRIFRVADQILQAGRNKAQEGR